VLADFGYIATMRSEGRFLQSLSCDPLPRRKRKDVEQ